MPLLVGFTAANFGNSNEPSIIYRLRQTEPETQVSNSSSRTTSRAMAASTSERASTGYHSFFCSPITFVSASFFTPFIEMQKENIFLML
jgi:hypothetical protein